MSSVGRTNGRRLSASEEATVRELRRIDIEVAGLFEWGLTLIDEIDEPGSRYLLAHAGREISRAIISIVTGETTIEAAQGPEDVEHQAARFRRRIATALDLSETHPNVTAWFRSHQVLVGGAHWRTGPPSATILREAFVSLADLLFGRIGPYFDTQAELDRLLTVTDPTPEQVKQLQRLTVRYTQRRYFFQRLSHPGWLLPLIDAGFFRDPPDRVMHEDGSWSIQQWPEGEAVVRLASAAPAIVSAVLRTMPRENANPAVWNVIVNAAVALPAAEATTLVPLIVHGVRNAPPVLFQRAVIGLIAKLADAGDANGAFELSNALLFVRRALKPSVQGGPKEDS